MSDGRSSGTMKVRCACGWEWAGDVEAVVAATQDHGTRIHNMEATREQVLAVLHANDPAPSAGLEAERP